MKKYILGIFAIAMSFLLVACGQNKEKSNVDNSLSQVKDRGTLIVALSPDYAPFEFQTLLDGKNQVVGIDVDIAKEIAKELGVKVKIQTMDFNNVLSSVANNRADLAISGISDSPERANAFEFSEPYYISENFFIVKKSAAKNYSNLKDLDKKKVSAQKGSIQEKILSDNVKGAEYISLQSTNSMVNELKNGTVDALLLDGMVAMNYVQSNPDLVVAENLKVKSDDSESNVIAMKKGSKELATEVNTIISKLKKDDFIEKSINKNYEYSKNANLSDDK